MKNAIVLVLFCLFATLAFAQQREADSLQKVIANYPKEDTTKIRLLTELAWWKYYFNQDTSLALLNQAYTISENLKNNKISGLINRELAYYYGYYNLREFSKSLEYALAALKLIEESQDKTQITITLIDIGHLYSLNNQYKIALDYYLRALKLCEDLKNEELIAYCYLDIKDVYEKSHEDSKTPEYDKKLMQAIENVKDEKQLGKIYLGMAIKQFELGKFDFTVTHALKAESLFNESKDIKLLRLATSGIGFVNHVFFKSVDEDEVYYPKTIFYYEKLLKLVENDDNIGYNPIPYFDKRVGYYLKNAGLIIGNDLINAYNVMGFSHSWKSKDLEKGLSCHLKAKKLAEKENSKANLYFSHQGLGQVYMYRKDYQKAIDFLSVLDKNDNLNNLYIAQCYKGLGKLDVSLSHALMAKEGLERNKEIFFIGASYELLSKIYEELDNYEQAFLYQKKFLKFKDSLAYQEKSRNLAMLEKQQTVALLEKDKKIQAEENKNQRLWLFSASGAFLSAILLAFVLYRNNQNKQKANKLLAEQKEELAQTNDTLNHAFKEIEKKNEDITASITYAKRIQTAMLPRMDDIQKALSESFILFKPRDIVSGDFYYFKEKENKIVIACADCTGHGVPGAFMSMIGNEILTNIVEIQGIISPDLILNELHKNIRTALKQGETENRDGMDISIVMIDKEKQILEYAGAMNPIYYVEYDFPNRTVANSDLESRTPVLKEIKADKLPIGGSQKEQERTFNKHTIELGVRSYELGVEKEQLQTSNSKPQTVFYLCSDGFQDQFGGSQGKKFMVKKFRELLFSIHHLPMDEQKQILDDTIERWMAEGKEHQIDDILVMGVRI